MAVQQASFYCPVCQQQRLFTAQGGVNQIFYLLLTLFSCGLWAIVWFIQNVSYTPRFHCSQCGFSDATKYLQNPNLRAQEAQLKAERAALGGGTSSPFSNSFTQWFSALSNGQKVFMVGAGFFVLIIFVGFIGALQSGNRQQSNRQSNTTSNVNATNAAQANMQNAANAVANAANAVATSTNKTSAPKNSCADIESELASVESDQARVEEMLDATEDFGPQAGSPKRAIYMNALKRKGELQLQHIALEKKLRACGKRR